MEYSLNSFSLDNLQEMVDDLSNGAKREYEIRMVAGNYDSFTDKQFIAMCNDPNICFWGGAEGVAKLRARMDKLGIKYN